MHYEKGQTVSSFLGDKLTTSPQCAGHVRDLYSLKEHSHIADARLKIIR